MSKQLGIKCSKCNTFKQATDDRIDKLVKKYGSQEELNKSYICRACRKDEPTNMENVVQDMLKGKN